MILSTNAALNLRQKGKEAGCACSSKDSFHHALP